jgi:hypothetical protein
MSSELLRSRRLWILLALVAITVGAGLFIWFRWPSPPEPREVSNPLSERVRLAREIQYNATVSLAARGSTEVRLDLLREMLDEEKQLNTFTVKLKNGKTVSDEALARKTILNALKAIRAWHNKVKMSDLSEKQKKELKKVHVAIDQLAEDSSVAPIRQEAKQTQKAIER